MLKDFLRDTQPVVYQALKNSCTDRRISSAWLFTGPRSTPKYEAAVLLAQSIFCEKQNGLACEECRTCRRVKDGSYADLIVLDGKENTISKEMVDALQDQFAKTALEKNGQRVYIIRCCENATAAAQNSMLKFLEEPPAGTTAILTTDNPNKILPTILSRCTILPFRPVNPDRCFHAAVSQGINEEDAYLLAWCRHNPAEIKAIAESAEYANAVRMLKQYLSLDGMYHREFLIDYDLNWRSHSTDRDKAKKSDLLLLQIFFELLNLWLHDAVYDEEHGPAWYQDALRHASISKKDAAEMIMIVNEEKDMVNKFNDLNLLMDQAFYRLEEYNHDNWL